jgi:TetR/AcrR family transcriptional regulator, tetracycline repressor protein
MQVPTSPKALRRPGERAGLTAEAVTSAARRLLHEHGPDALSMRRIAAELGVLPNALYSHVADKQALLDALVDQLLGEIKPIPGPTWRDRSIGVLQATRSALLTEPELAMLYAQRPGRGPNAIRLGQYSMQIAADAGMKTELAADAFRVLLAYTVGFVAFEIARSGSSRTVRDLPPEAGLDELARGAGEREFNLGLAWLLDGIDATMRSSST